METLMDEDGLSQASQPLATTHIDTRPVGYNPTVVAPPRRASPVPSETGTVFSVARGPESKIRQFDQKAHGILTSAVERLNERDREIRTLRQGCKTLQSKVERLEWEVKSTRDQETRLTAAKQGLKTKLEETYRDHCVLQDKLKEQGQNLRRLETSRAADSRRHRDEVESLQEEVQQSRRDNEEQKKLAAELRSKVDALQAKREKLEQELGCAFASGNTIATLEAQLQTETRLAESLSAQVQELNAEAEKRKLEFLKSTANLQEEVLKSRTEMDILEKENNQLKASAHTNRSNHNTLEEEMFKLQAALDRNREEKAVLEGRVEEAGTRARDQEERHRSAIGEYEKELEASRAQIAALTDEIEAVTGDMTNRLNLEDTMAELERLTQLKDTGAKAIHEANRQWEMNDKLTRENLALKRHLDQEEQGHAPYLEPDEAEAEAEAEAASESGTPESKHKNGDVRN